MSFERNFERLICIAAKEHDKNVWRNEPYGETTHEQSFKSGAETACVLLIEKIEKLQKQNEKLKDAIYAQSECIKRLKDTFSERILTQEEIYVKKILKEIEDEK